MRAEGDLIPYAATRLVGSPLLVLAPHPDDEIFGCSAVMLEGVRSGADVHVVIVTDGGAQGEFEVRREESREAARRLGTPEPAFWGLADRSLEADLGPLNERIRSSLADLRPELVLIPSPAEIHPDHRAVCLATYGIVRDLAACDPRLLPKAFRLAAYEVSAFLRPNVLVDLTADWPAIEHASRAFASQNAVQPYLEVIGAMATARRITLPDAVERAAGYHVVDRDFITAHDVRTWAGRIGPTEGLELDDPRAGRPPRRPFVARLFGDTR
jgi:LmbE family N-acetylglucosaminyl deacetylase